ncbi:universal stress protein [Acaricomes phytoseiuli]|uniref:universal stress protein n=1 Tax=Acaricomes phytoseiuli TaxID=291968 RepID=UPI0003717EA3|nr:universal stress protein [Acaricomes phytoseiuli]MCW1249920.1 universal stress protein [Acaricomes phytoseiuli]
MTVLVASAESAESQSAMTAAIAEALRRDEDLLAFSLDGTTPDTAAAETAGITVTVDYPNPQGKDAAGDLLDAAERSDASVIVIGIRRRSPEGKIFLGSIAQQVILEARAPVLAVKPG